MKINIENDAYRRIYQFSTPLELYNWHTSFQGRWNIHESRFVFENLENLRILFGNPTQMNLRTAPNARPVAISIGVRARAHMRTHARMTDSKLLRPAMNIGWFADGATPQSPFVPPRPSQWLPSFRELSQARLRARKNNKGAVVNGSCLTVAVDGEHAPNQKAGSAARQFC